MEVTHSAAPRCEESDSAVLQPWCGDVYGCGSKPRQIKTSPNNLSKDVRFQSPKRYTTGFDPTILRNACPEDCCLPFLKPWPNVPSKENDIIWFLQVQHVRISDKISWLSCSFLRASYSPRPLRDWFVQAEHSEVMWLMWCLDNASIKRPGNCLSLSLLPGASQRPDSRRSPVRWPCDCGPSWGHVQSGEFWQHFSPAAPPKLMHFNAVLALVRL